jgi:hypothetical protein
MRPRRLGLWLTVGPFALLDAPLLQQGNFQRLALALLNQLQRPDPAHQGQGLQRQLTVERGYLALLQFRQFLFLGEKGPVAGCVPELLYLLCYQCHPGNTAKEFGQPLWSVGSALNFDAPALLQKPMPEFRSIRLLLL